MRPARHPAPCYPFTGSIAADCDRDGARACRSDTANLLRALPGFSVQGAGGVSGLPSVHGMMDDRLRIQVDGMDLVSACGNPRNPPLSFIDPTRAGSVRVFAGAVPVSVGGDSIRATIQVEAAPPEFAAPGQGTLLKGEAGTFYRINGNGVGANVSATDATEQMSLPYHGAVAQANNYKSAHNFKPAGPASDKPPRWLGRRRNGRYQLQNPQPRTRFCAARRCPSARTETGPARHS